jgi:hypothetical protein
LEKFLFYFDSRSRGGDLNERVQIRKQMNNNKSRNRDLTQRGINAIAVLLICGYSAGYAAAQQVSIWAPTAVPATVTDSDSNATEVGLKFQSSVAGNVTGVRFYKGPYNTGTHVAHLWTGGGSLLATVTFANETASGWQQANFSTPVAIQANTTYVVSYYCPNGHYPDDQNSFTSAVTNAPLTALPNSTASPNGVYVYGSGAFPNQSWNASNYWVDLTFVATNSIWTSSTVPGTVTESDPSSVELGVKFQSTVAGNVAGVRFYKGSSNTGTHVGHLWTNTGALLGTVTFSNETASGWQQANFSTPIAIQPNTTYIISYYCPNGHYSGDQNYFASAVTKTPLTALQNTTSHNGVYVYGSGGFPTQSWNASNYWVDLAFVPTGTSGGSTSGGSTSGGSTGPTTYSISGTVTGSAATLTLAGSSTGSTTTNASGAYNFSGLANGSYVVAPGHSGYSFTPSTASITVNGANVSGVNFTATANPVTVQHSVTLNWTASTSSNVLGYNVYRSTTSSGPFTEIHALVAGTSYVDSTVSSGMTYYYVTTAVDSSNTESGYSNQTTASVPTP